MNDKGGPNVAMTEIVISLIALLKIAILAIVWMSKRYFDRNINGKIDRLISHSKKCEKNQQKVIKLWEKYQKENQNE